MAVNCAAVVRFSLYGDIMLQLIDQFGGAEPVWVVLIVSVAVKIGPRQMMIIVLTDSRILALNLGFCVIRDHD